MTALLQSLWHIWLYFKHCYSEYQLWNVLWFTDSPYRMSVTAHETFSAQSTTKKVKVKISLSDKFLEERHVELFSDSGRYLYSVQHWDV